MKACAPGKIILSGEHAVVHGAPALAVAVQQYSHVSFHADSPQSIQKSQTAASDGVRIRTEFERVTQPETYSENRLSAWVSSLDTRYQDYLAGHRSVSDITQSPNELALYSLLQHCPNMEALHSGTLKSRTDLPLGAGMGSSASVIAALLVLSEQIFNAPQTTEQRFQQVRHCERLQHGQGSALDAATVTYGGLLTVQGDTIIQHPAQLDAHWYWAYTGKPENSTGECVQQVREHHTHDQALWSAFADVTQTLLPNAASTTESTLLSVKENHRLLCRIGVVPNAVQQLIKDIEGAGGAAKISGAGAISGDGGGLMLAYLPDNVLEHIQTLPRLSSLAWHAIEVDTHGARLSN